MSTIYDAPAASPAPDLQHSAAEEEYLNQLYAELSPEAVEKYLNHFLSRTPAHLQEDMKELVMAGLTDAITPDALANIGAPRSQLVDVEAFAQATAKSVGNKEAQAAREAAMEVAQPNPANTKAPRVNIEPTADGPALAQTQAEPAAPVYEAPVEDYSGQRA